MAEGFLPKAEHSFLAPGAAAARAAGESDFVFAWSLGAWHALAAAAAGVGFQGRVFLLAPFLSFCAEDNLGGRCSRTQVKFLRRWIAREPEAALIDFYARAGLRFSPPSPSCPLDVLTEGLDTLLAGASPELLRFAEQGLPKGWEAVVGRNDPLLDAEAVCRSIRGCAPVSGATHALETLLPALQTLRDAV